jgi:hypothetical protein
MQQKTKAEAIRVACIQMRRGLILLLRALDDFLGYTGDERPYANDH